MKKVIKSGIFLFFAAYSVMSFATSSDVRELSHFDEVVVSSNIELVLEQSDEERAEIFTRVFSSGEVKTDISKGVLKISIKNSVFSEKKYAKVVLNYRVIRSLKLKAGAQVFTRGSMEVDKLEIKAASGANGEISVDVNALEVSANEGAVLKLNGNAHEQEVKVNTGAEVDAYHLECDHTYVRTSTGGIAKVFAHVTIDASANTGGEIDYRGNPKNVQAKTNLKGEVREH